MDTRTKRQKLEAMANQTTSPEEAEVAKKKLEKLGPEIKLTSQQAVLWFGGKPITVDSFSVSFVYDIDPSKIKPSGM